MAFSRLLFPEAFFPKRMIVLRSGILSEVILFGSSPFSIPELLALTGKKDIVCFSLMDLKFFAENSTNMGWIISLNL